MVAAWLGRSMDASGRLPWVHESQGLRGGSSAWAAVLLLAVALGMVIARRWRTEPSFARIVPLVIIGQMSVFLGGEAVVRVTNHREPIDPDGLAGAALQALLALLLLAALATAWWARLMCRRYSFRAARPRAESAATVPQRLSSLHPRDAMARSPPRLRCPQRPVLIHRSEGRHDFTKAGNHVRTSGHRDRRSRELQQLNPQGAAKHKRGCSHGGFGGHSLSSWCRRRGQGSATGERCADTGRSRLPDAGAVRQDHLVLRGSPG